jgi:uncharacterized protein
VLTADLVRARRRDGELQLVPLDDRARAGAVEIAAQLLRVAREHVGQTRDELREAFATVEVAARARRLADGLVKLVEDAAEFESPTDFDPAELRAELFLEAARARRERAPGERIHRAELVRAAAAARSFEPAAFERALYADLRGAQRLIRLEPLDAEALVARYERGRVQAVLLRAVRVSAEVRCASPGAYRALFRKLKFRRLLYEIHALDGGGYRIDIDGPFSLFESVTKYGLNLALVLPALEECDVLKLTAELRWGKAREPLRFRHEHRTPARAAAREALLPDEVAALLDAFRALNTPWRVEPSRDILELPGVGLCVPDLVFYHRETGEVVHLEVMGYWSRDAVWRRVELVEAGLPARILFAVSSRLRVSEEVLPADAPGALYVYKGTMSARAVARKLDGLAGET